ncbi:MAG: hypothetical protein IJN04_04860 [Clostridia bacterium]|nr:hypothetical protein [Clostridia bacterium]
MSEQYENNNIEVELTADTPTEERPVTRRYNKRGKRRGKYAYAAPVGFLVSLLSIVGVVALVMSVVGFIQKQTDDTALKEELYYYLEPLLLYSPEPFDNAAKEEQDAFLNAAAYRVMLAENIRMLREGAEYPKYPVDESYRIAVPVEEVKASYAALFGKKAKLSHRTIEDIGLEYSEADECYYIPFAEQNSGYVFVIDKITKTSSKYEVRVGFVSVTDIKYDEHGQSIPPTAEQATHFQVYTLTRDEDTYFIKSCKDE